MIYISSVSTIISIFESKDRLFSDSAWSPRPYFPKKWMGGAPENLNTERKMVKKFNHENHLIKNQKPMKLVENMTTVFEKKLNDVIHTPSHFLVTDLAQM